MDIKNERRLIWTLTLIARGIAEYNFTHGGGVTGTDNLPLLNMTQIALNDVGKLMSLNQEPDTL